MTNYLELTSRNRFFISEELQLRIKNAGLVLAGCGLSSSFAVTAARIGFENFVLADGDKVELTNLNRQAFFADQIGENKAKATSDLLKQINPNIKARVIDSFITASEAKELVASGDIVINTVDFNEVTYLVNEAAMSQSKLCIFPLNVGFGALILIFSEASKTLNDIIGGRIVDSDTDFLLNLYQGLIDYYLPGYVRDNLKELFSFINQKSFFPQNAIAANINAALMSTIILDHLNGKELPLAPTPVFVDARSVLT